MQILMIAQYLNLPGQEEDRFFKLGRNWIEAGHQVSVISINSGTGLELGKKKVGLVQHNGVPVIALNAPYSPQMSNGQKALSYLRFARMALKQGLDLPRPDLILAASPPLTALWPALKLAERFEAGLIIELRELWPDAPVQRGSLKSELMIKALKRLESRAYEQADRLVADGVGIGEALKERGVNQSKITVIPRGTAVTELFGSYDTIMTGLTEKNK